jgi:hypothetical protein
VSEIVGSAKNDTFVAGSGADEFAIAITSAGVTAADFLAALATVTSFDVDADTLTFGAAAGGANYEEGTAASFADALTAAGTELDGVTLYYAVEVGSDTYVFYDADTTIDTAGTEVVKLTGVSIADFDASHIVA